MHARIPPLLCLLSASLAAQAASYTYIDQQPPYANPTWLTALNLPQLGSTFRVQVPFSIYTCCPFQRDYWLATGFGNPNLRFPALGGFLYTTGDLQVLRTYNGITGPYQFVDFPIPSSTALIGAQFFQQVLERAANSFWTTLTLSRGGHGVIGT